MNRVVRQQKPTAMERLQERIGRLSQRSRVERSIARALAAPRDPLPATLVDEFAAVFGDPTLTGEFNQAAMAAIERGSGPILQCGAGMNTILFGLLAQRANRHLWVLEEDLQWANWTRSKLKEFNIGRAHVIAVPAALVEDHVAYVIDSSRLPKDFSLVLCHGSSARAGGLRGVLQRLAKRMDHRCIVLARNLRHPRDLDFASKWSKGRNAPFMVNGKDEPFGKIALRDQRSTQALEDERADTVYGKQNLIEVNRAI